MAGGEGGPRLTSTTWSPPARGSGLRGAGPLSEPGSGTPAPRAVPRAQVDDAVLLEVLTRCAGAATTHEVAGAVVAPLRALRGVRAAMLVEAAAPRADAVVLGSDGYDCAAMAVGAVLPNDSGLPVTEAVRTSAPVVRTAAYGPSWTAVPVPREGRRRSALLVSCSGPALEGLAVLERLAQLVGPALDRAAQAGAAREEAALIEEGLAPALPQAPGLLVRSRPFEGRLTGDVVALEQVAGARWLLVADVSGRGAAAAVVGDRLRAAFAAVVPGSLSPAAVLRALDRAVAAGEERFATALVLRLGPGPVVAATAGHPAPLVVGESGAVPLVLVPGPPLGLGLDGVADWRDTPTGITAGDGGSRQLLLAWTDGLLDRESEVDLLALLAELPPLPATDLADAVEQGCTAVGPHQDDTTLVLLEL